MRRVLSTAALFTLGTLAMSARATNGMNPIASGAQAAGRGGVDQAVATEATAMNTNPAGITQAPMRIDATLSLLMPSIKQTDTVTMPTGAMTLNDGVSAQSQVFPLMNAGFTAKLWDGLYGGIGVATQGGMGAEFKGLRTFHSDPGQPGVPVPGTYDLYSQVMYLKATPTLAYRIAKLAPGFDLSLGAALNVGMSSMEFRHGGIQFPEPANTSGLYAQHALKFKSDWATGYAVRVGALAELLDKKLTVGASYQSKTVLKYKGTAGIDGMLDYDAQMDFAWPQEVAGGIAVRPVSGLLLGADIRWINWADTMGTVPLTGTAKGQAPQGMGTLTLPFQMNWRDQLVYAVGGEYEIVPLVVARLGYNYGKSPVRPDGINPLFPAVSEHHVTLGAGIRPVPNKLSIDAALEVSPTNTVTSSGTNQLAHQPGTTTPNGYGTSVSMSQLTVHLGAGYRF